MTDNKNMGKNMTELIRFCPSFSIPFLYTRTKRFSQYKRQFNHKSTYINTYATAVCIKAFLVNTSHQWVNHLIVLTCVRCIAHKSISKHPAATPLYTRACLYSDIALKYYWFRTVVCQGWSLGRLILFAKWPTRLMCQWYPKLCIQSTSPRGRAPWSLFVHLRIERVFGGSSYRSMNKTRYQVYRSR